MRAVRKRPALVVAIVILSLVGLVSLPAGAGSPITPANRPTPLPNAVNGEVAPSRLVNVGPNCIAAREAAPSLMRIFTMARQAQVALGAEECYRTLANEVKFANQANQPGNNPACVSTARTSTRPKP